MVEYMWKTCRKHEEYVKKNVENLWKKTGQVIPCQLQMPSQSAISKKASTCRKYVKKMWKICKTSTRRLVETSQELQMLSSATLDCQIS